ncbi:hypothetical protein FA09DRAFT_361224 [Tilletiopsis washingtonensis]|uniref:Uncharacterized protein n=1 Tax=Tilletiopsis washingtonensis TaxID=58919 RepID=A0A316Z6J7_9BASI|nr:hypothetical protein FA09DRAFT_361224 [Tilletiopsis washingtonensis]PWN97410.1 hypothetical protein FA09DRAFT_361224 [Tilletiopsis washingtonensis]
MPEPGPRDYREAKVFSLSVRAEYQENKLEIDAVQTQITKLQEELAFLERNGRTLKSLSRRTLDDIANKMVNDAENMAAQMQEIRDRAGSDDPAALKAAFKAIFTELPEEEDDYESFSREASDEETSAAEDDSDEEMELSGDGSAAEQSESRSASPTLSGMEYDAPAESADEQARGRRPRSRAQASSTANAPRLSPSETVMVQAEAVSLRARAKYESALIAIEDMQEGLEKLKGGLPELKRQASRSVTDIAKELKRGYLEEAFFQITGQRPPTRKGDDDGAAGSKTSERDAGAEKSGGTRGLQGPALAAAKLGAPVRKIAGRAAPKQKPRASKAGNAFLDRAEAAQPEAHAEGSRSAQRPSGSSNREYQRRA